MVLFVVSLQTFAYAQFTVIKCQSAFAACVLQMAALKLVRNNGSSELCLRSPINIDHGFV